jgi:deoxyribonuclease (pyrimidine dimer)
MVRVNLVLPKTLADQHLIAEYNEILMLAAYIRAHPDTSGLPERYCLGKGHMRFFKDKLVYLKNRHEMLKKEMRKRGFRASKSISLASFSSKNRNDWTPTEKDFAVIRKRITAKLELKPGYYRYYGKYMPAGFFVGLIGHQSRQHKI